MDPQTLVGKTLGEYRVQELLALGGMGVVYRGERTGGGVVAIKVLLPEYVSEPVLVQRFVDEANALKGVEHPGLLRIFDCRREEQVGTYLVMELLRGETLLDRFDRCGRFPAITVVRLLRQAADCLAATHRAGVVHRDLKPSNLFLVPDHALPGGERLKVLDFGIAKLLDRRIGIDDLTKTGSTMGTPAFMAPEQGIDAKRVDHRADIYSLGVVAYYLLSERLPTTGEGMLQIYIKQASRPVRLSEAGLALPVAVEEAVMKCLEPTREERFQSMAELLEALPDEEEMRGWSETPAPSVKQLAPIAPAPHLPSSPAGLPTNAAWPPPGAEPTMPSPSPAAEGPTVLASSSAAAALERPDPLPQVQNRDAVIVTEETVLLRSAEPAPPKAEPLSSSPTAALAELATMIERPSDAPSTSPKRVTLVEQPAAQPAVRELADVETVIQNDTLIEPATVIEAAKGATETLAQAETLIKVRAPGPAARTPGRQQEASKGGRGWLLLALLVALAALLVTAALILARADQGSRTVIEAIDGG